MYSDRVGQGEEAQFHMFHGVIWMKPDSFTLGFRLCWPCYAGGTKEERSKGEGPLCDSVDCDIQPDVDIDHE